MLSLNFQKAVERIIGKGSLFGILRVIHIGWYVRIRQAWGHAVLHRTFQRERSPGKHRIVHLQTQLIQPRHSSGWSVSFISYLFQFH